MRELACRIRANQLYYHSCHNLVDGQAFFADHDFFKEAYKAHEKAYDRVIERMIGSGDYENLEVSQFHHDVATKLEGSPSVEVRNAEDYYRYALKIELGTIQMLEAIIRAEGITKGTENMLADLADKAEVRVYKIQARLQKRD